MASGPDGDRDYDKRAPEGQSQHRTGMGLWGCPWCRWTGALGRLMASCIEMEGTAFMWVSGGLRAQGSMSALEPGSERRPAPSLALWGSEETSLKH